jgi:hypothetical protein
MAVQADTSGRSTLTGQRWYARTPDEVAAVLDVDPGTGISSPRAAELLRANGPKQRGQSMSSLHAGPPAVVRVSRNDLGG